MASSAPLTCRDYKAAIDACVDSALGASIPTQDSRPDLPHLNSIPSTEALPLSPSLESERNVNIPSVPASPSLPALPSSSALSAQPSMLEQAITKALKNPCIFFGLGCDKQFDFLHKDYSVSFEYKGLKYECATAAIEAQKFAHNRELMEKFAKVKANDVCYLSASLWISAPKLANEETIHYDVQLAKFSQNPDLSLRLLLTADAYLASHVSFWASDTPSVWTDGHDGKGENKSGQILMQIRKDLGGIGVVAKPDNFEALVKKLEASKF